MLKSVYKHMNKFRHIFSSLFLFFCLHGFFASAEAAPLNPTPIKIVALGDSLTAGYGLAPNAGFVPQLQKRLGDEVVIINAGVSGDTTMGGLARLGWSVPSDTDIVILELGANDALRGIDPALTRKNLAAIITHLQAQNIDILLAGMFAPRNYGDGYIQAFDAIYPALAQQYNIALFPFFLQDVAGVPALNLADGIHPNKKGVALIVQNILPHISALIEKHIKKYQGIK